MQGDSFANNVHVPDGDFDGGNLVARWSRMLANGSSLMLQAYYDRADRMLEGVTDELETHDVEGQHTVDFGRHQLVWGGGYRVQQDRFDNQLNPFVLTPIAARSGKGEASWRAK